MQSSSSNAQVLMVRQPIFGPDLKIIAYELLMDRTSDDETVLNPDRDTSQVLLNTYTSLCQDGSIQRVPLFISLSQDLLLKGYTPNLPPKQVVLQIPAGIRLGPQVLGNIQMLANNGYRLALDGFALQRHLIPLLKYMSIVKVDVRAVPGPQLQKLVGILARSKAKLLAQHIASFADLQGCKKLGFRFFQGPFISRPVRVMGKQLPGNSVALMQLIHELQKPSTTAEAIEALIILDPILTYKILRVVNSAAYNLPNKIESLSQAIVLMGLDQVRKWATLIALSSQDNKPEELSRNLLVRGRLCQLLAEQRGDANPESCFMVGILSQLDALLEMEMDELLAQIPLDDEIKLAISQHRGVLGSILLCVEHYEQGNWEALKALQANTGFFEAAYRHSLSWAQSAMQTLNDT